MTGIIFGIGSLVVIIAGYIVIKSVLSNSNAKAIESKISYEVNKLIKKATSKNIDQIKFEIESLMNEYRETKAKEFASTLRVITENLCNFEKAIASIQKSIAKIQGNVDALKSSGKTDAESIKMGAQYLQMIDQFKNSKAQLEAKTEEFNRKRQLIDNQIDMFDSRFSLKKAQIDTLLATVTSIESGSTKIDIQLDNLVEEFKLKAVEEETTQRVLGVQENNDIVDSYDASYEDKFRELIGASNN